MATPNPCPRCGSPRLTIIYYDGDGNLIGGRLECTLNKGGIIEKEMPINISNVALFNPATQKADRVGFKQLDDGRKVRVFKANGEVVDA